MGGCGGGEEGLLGSGVRSLCRRPHLAAARPHASCAGAPACGCPSAPPTAAHAVGTTLIGGDEAASAADEAVGGMAMRAGVAGRGPAGRPAGGAPAPTDAPVRAPGRGVSRRGIGEGEVPGG